MPVPSMCSPGSPRWEPACSSRGDDGLAGAATCCREHRLRVARPGDDRAGDTVVRRRVRWAGSPAAAEGGYTVEPGDPLRGWPRGGVSALVLAHPALVLVGHSYGGAVINPGGHRNPNVKRWSTWPRRVGGGSPSTMPLKLGGQPGPGQALVCARRSVRRGEHEWLHRPGFFITVCSTCGHAAATWHRAARPAQRVGGKSGRRWPASRPGTGLGHRQDPSAAESGDGVAGRLRTREIDSISHVANTPTPRRFPADRVRPGLAAGFMGHMAVTVIRRENTPGALAGVAARSGSGRQHRGAACVGKTRDADDPILVRHAEAAKHSRLSPGQSAQSTTWWWSTCTTARVCSLTCPQNRRGGSLDSSKCYHRSRGFGSPDLLRK